MEAMYKIVEDHETKKMGNNGINHVRVSQIYFKHHNNNNNNNNNNNMILG